MNWDGKTGSRLTVDIRVELSGRMFVCPAGTRPWSNTHNMGGGDKELSQKTYKVLVKFNFFQDYNGNKYQWGKLAGKLSLYRAREDHC